MKSNFNDGSLAVFVVEYGTPECGGEPQVLCTTSVENLRSLKHSLLYKDCVIVERHEYDMMKMRLNTKP